MLNVFIIRQFILSDRRNFKIKLQSKNHSYVKIALFCLFIKFKVTVRLRKFRVRLICYYVFAAGVVFCLSFVYRHIVTNWGAQEHQQQNKEERNLSRGISVPALINTPSLPLTGKSWYKSLDCRATHPSCAPWKEIKLGLFVAKNMQQEQHRASELFWREVGQQEAQKDLRSFDPKSNLHYPLHQIHQSCVTLRRKHKSEVDKLITGCILFFKDILKMFYVDK